MAERLPRRVVVERVVRGRYSSGTRPVSWNDRIPGEEEIVSRGGETLSLFSSGGQSTPAPGWELLLTDRNPSGGLNWTLYGIKSR